MKIQTNDLKLYGPNMAQEIDAPKTGRWQLVKIKRSINETLMFSNNYNKRSVFGKRENAS